MLFLEMVRRPKLSSRGRIAAGQIRIQSEKHSGQELSLPSRRSDNEAELNKRQLTYEGGKINHYWNKSFEEFAAKKLRGDSLEMSEGRNNEYKRVFDQFFAWNVPARPQYYDPCPQSVISMVSSTREKLFELTGVRVLHREILKRFDDLLRPIGGPDGARRIFEELALQYPDLTFEGH